MKRLLYLVAAGIVGVLLGGLGGLIAAQAVPKCGEDCFAFTGGLIVGGAFVGMCIVLVVSIGCRSRSRSWLWIALIAIVLVVGARLAILRHFSKMHDTEGSHPTIGASAPGSHVLQAAFTLHARCESSLESL